MTNIFIIHGIGGSPEGNWFPWLKAELEKLGCRVFVPRFPTPEGQSLEAWLSVFREYEKFLDKESIVVGHSLGVAFLLSVLEGLGKPIRAAFFVSGFAEPLGDPQFDVPNKTFVDKHFDWTKIKKNCKSFYVINSDDDPYVPLERGKTIAKNLGTGLIVLENAGHINLESGYAKFGFLLEKIKKELK